MEMDMVPDTGDDTEADADTDMDNLREHYTHY
jgi:hypothetical protein